MNENFELILFALEKLHEKLQDFWMEQLMAANHFVKKRKMNRTMLRAKFEVRGLGDCALDPPDHSNTNNGKPTNE